MNNAAEGAFLSALPPHIYQREKFSIRHKAAQPRLAMLTRLSVFNSLKKKHMLLFCRKNMN